MPHVLRTARHCRGQPPGSVWMEDVKALMDNKAVDCADKCVDSPGSNTTNDYACGLNLILFVDLAVFSRVNPPEAMVALTRKFWLGKNLLQKSRSRLRSLGSVVLPTLKRHRNPDDPASRCP